MIPMLEDNYGYLGERCGGPVLPCHPKLMLLFGVAVVDRASKQAAVVDPVEPQKVLAAVRTHGVTLSTVLTTHKVSDGEVVFLSQPQVDDVWRCRVQHWDHAGGNNELVALMRAEGVELQVLGGALDDVPSCTRAVGDRDSFNIGALRGSVFAAPCHTRGHVLYCVEEPGSSPALFTGDTLFIGGVFALYSRTPLWGDAARCLWVVQ